MKNILLDLKELEEKLYVALDMELARSKWKPTPRISALAVELESIRTARIKAG